MNVQGTRTFNEQTLTTEKLHYWDKTTDIAMEHDGVDVNISELAYKLSEASDKQTQGMQADIAKTTKQTEVNSPAQSVWNLSAADKLKIQLLEKLIEAISGKKVKFKILDSLGSANKEATQVSLPANLQRKAKAVKNQSLASWGMTSATNTSYKEEERTAFKATGLVRTADGQKISVSLDLAMSRQFTMTTGINVDAGSVLKDPLVLNFDGKATQLTGANFQFDLDADGTPEDMPFVQDGSGFLALDKNGDNVINNGSELFGVKTGQGFSELAAYDEDHNNWIDENDAVFTKLKVWTKDENGNDQLFTLGEKGVGAIYLGQAKTQFALKDQNNSLMGEIKSTGIFLTDKGQARTIQQVDLSI